MAIPALDSRGLLPPGTHCAHGWEEIALHFANNAHRAKLLEQMQLFIENELASVASGLAIYIGGSYLSDKPVPSDIDCTVMVPVDQVASWVPLMILAADGAKGRIYEQYGIEFYLTLSGPGMVQGNFTAFFAYVGEKTAQARNLDAKDLRGIVKVTAWTPQ